MFIYVLYNKSTRESFFVLIKLFFTSKIRILWFTSLMYVFFITFLFYQLPCWDSSYIKDVVEWFLFTGLICCMNSVAGDTDETYIKKILKDNFKLIVIIEFLMSTFTFNICIELISIPIVIIIMTMSLILEHKNEYRSAQTFLNFVLSLIGFLIIIGTIKVGIHEYKNLNILNTFISFMIPLIYLILFIPVMYLFELWSKYENLFVKMSFVGEKEKNIQRRRQWLVFKECKLSIHKVLLFQKRFCMKILTDEFETILDDFKTELSNENK